MTTDSDPIQEPNKAEWLADTRLEGAAHLATAFAALVSMVSIILGVLSIQSQNKQYAEQSKQFENQVSIQRELAISDRWQDHIRISIANPKLSTATPDIANFTEEEKEQYIWFSEDMIFASERILQYAPKDPQWVNTIIYEMRVKKPYILSDDFLACPKGETLTIQNCSDSRLGNDSSSYCTYIPELRELIRRAFREDEAASTKLKLAESKCHWDVPTATVGIQPNA